MRRDRICFFRYFVISLVPFILFLSILMAYIGVIDLSVELHTLVIITFIFIVFITFTPHNSYISVCKFKSGSIDLKDRLKSFIKLHSVRVMKQKKSIEPIEIFLAKEFRSLRNDNYASVASIVFPTLGILGTFIAIALSMPDFSVQNSSELDREITKLLGGVGTAFYASIYGIFLSLWWLFFDKRGVSLLEDSAQNLKDEYSDYFWKDNELKVIGYMVYEEQNKTLIDSLNSILNLDMVHKLNAINESRLEMIEKFTKSEEIIHRKVEKMYTLVLDLHREALAKETQTMRLFDSVNTSLTSYNSALESRSDTLSVFTKELRSISESLNSFKDDISLSLKLQRSISGSIDRFVELSRDFDRRFSSNVDYTMKSIDSEVADIVKKLALLAHSIANEGRVIQDSLNQYFKEENRKK